MQQVAHAHSVVFVFVLFFLSIWRHGVGCAHESHRSKMLRARKHKTNPSRGSVQSPCPHVVSLLLQESTCLPCLSHRHGLQRATRYPTCTISRRHTRTHTTQHRKRKRRRPLQHFVCESVMRFPPVIGHKYTPECENNNDKNAKEKARTSGYARDSTAEDGFSTITFSALPASHNNTSPTCEQWSITCQRMNVYRQVGATWANAD
jgi:hypothetical protein